ncbi:MAG: 2-hydroxychromene-2-carboxylate isomerase [Solirubrobacteraceae bacterium]
MEPVFFYDFNSPYAYLAAQRIDALVPGARWQPIGFAFLLIAQQREPWSFGEQRDEGKAECERRAAERGLPALVWPPEWPKGSYTLDPMRAALYAEEQGLLREYTDAAFARNFVAGSGLTGNAPYEVAAEIGLDPDATRAAVAGPARARLKEVTEAAIAAGVPGVPTVTIGGEHFWGDDRLEAAAGRL